MKEQLEEIIALTCDLKLSEENQINIAEQKELVEKITKKTIAIFNSLLSEHSGPISDRDALFDFFAEKLRAIAIKETLNFKKFDTKWGALKEAVTSDLCLSSERMCLTTCVDERAVYHVNTEMTGRSNKSGFDQFLKEIEGYFTGQTTRASLINFLQTVNLGSDRSNFFAHSLAHHLMEGSTRDNAGESITFKDIKDLKRKDFFLGKECMYFGADYLSSEARTEATVFITNIYSAVNIFIDLKNEQLLLAKEFGYEQQGNQHFSELQQQFLDCLLVQKEALKELGINYTFSDKAKERNRTALDDSQQMLARLRLAKEQKGIVHILDGLTEAQQRKVGAALGTDKEKYEDRQGAVDRFCGKVKREMPKILLGEDVSTTGLVSEQDAPLIHQEMRENMRLFSGVKRFFQFLKDAFLVQTGLSCMFDAPRYRCQWDSIGHTSTSVRVNEVSKAFSTATTLYPEELSESRRSQEGHLVAACYS